MYFTSALAAQKGEAGWFRSKKMVGCLDPKKRTLFTLHTLYFDLLMHGKRAVPSP